MDSKEPMFSSMENPNPHYVPPGCGKKSKEDLNLQYYRAGISDWKFVWDTGDCIIDNIEQETIIRYPDGKVKIMLKNASVSLALLNALRYGELNHVQLIHTFTAIPTKNVNQRLAMEEVFSSITVQRAVEVGRTDCVSEILIFAQKDD
jgi:hypothetical protein